MLIRRALFVALLAVLSSIALAEDHPGDGDKKFKRDRATKLPINPYADAKEGDWSTFIVTQKAADTGETSLSIWTWRVASVGEDGTVKVTTEHGGKDDSRKDHLGNPFSTKEAPSVEKFFGDDVQEVTAATDEKVTHESQAFECKKLVFTADKATKTWTVWLSPAVKGSGIVSGTMVKGQRTGELKLAGHGTKTKTEWGKTPEEAQKAIEKPVVEAALDLSTKEKLAEALLKALEADDKETFRKCVTKRILERQKDRFDEWFKVWKDDCARHKLTVEMLAKKVAMTQEGDAWKLDEN